MYKSLIPLLLVVVANAAFAAEKMPEGKPMPAPAPTALEQAEPQAPVKRAYSRKHKRLPRGDLRACLELKDNAAIIKCAETRK